MGKIIKTYLLYFLILVYVCGSIGFLLKPSFFMPFTPYTLLFTCFVFLLHQSNANFKFYFTFIGIAIIGFLIEVIGVKTSLVFGSYYYGNVLGYKFLSVPLVISINWALLITSGAIVSSYVSSNKYGIALLASFIITALDFIIEQVATPLNFWYFAEGVAGIHNYIGWFLICFFAVLFLQNQLIKGQKKIAVIVLVLQTFFFGLIYIFKTFNHL